MLDLSIFMFFEAIIVGSRWIRFLPAYSIYRTSSDRVIDIVSLVVFEWSDTGESLLIELEYIARYGSTRATADTSTVNVRFSH